MFHMHIRDYEVVDGELSIQQDCAVANLLQICMCLCTKLCTIIILDYPFVKAPDEHLIVMGYT